MLPTSTSCNPSTMFKKKNTRLKQQHPQETGKHWWFYGRIAAIVHSVTLMALWKHSPWGQQSTVTVSWRASQHFLLPPTRSQSSPKGKASAVPRTHVPFQSCGWSLSGASVGHRRCVQGVTTASTKVWTKFQNLKRVSGFNKKNIKKTKRNERKQKQCGRCTPLRIYTSRHRAGDANK